MSAAYFACLLNDVVQCVHTGLGHNLATAEASSRAEETRIVMILGLIIMYVLVELACSGSLAHFVERNEDVERRLLLILLCALFHLLGETSTAVDTFLCAVVYAAADTCTIVSEVFSSVSIDEGRNLGPVAVEVDSHKENGLADSAEVDGAVIEFGRNADDKDRC